MYKHIYIYIVITHILELYSKCRSKFAVARTVHFEWWWPHLHFGSWWWWHMWHPKTRHKTWPQMLWVSRAWHSQFLGASLVLVNVCFSWCFEDFAWFIEYQPDHTWPATGAAQVVVNQNPHQKEKCLQALRPLAGGYVVMSEWGINSLLNSCSGCVPSNALYCPFLLEMTWALVDCNISFQGFQLRTLTLSNVNSNALGKGMAFKSQGTSESRWYGKNICHFLAFSWAFLVGYSFVNGEWNCEWL